MIKIGICDDDEVYVKFFLDKLKDEFAKISSDKDIEYMYYQNPKQAIEDAKKDEIDVYFIDIEYGDLLGMDVARAIEKVNSNVGIVYMTNYEHYAVNAFVCRPLGFIRKEHLEGELLGVLFSVNDYLDKYNRKYEFKNGNSFMSISIASIIYIEMRDHYMIIHSKCGDVELRDKISRVEKDLTSAGYVKIHRSILVNLKYVLNIKNDEMLLASGEKIYITKEKIREIFFAWQEYKMKY